MIWVENLYNYVSFNYELEINIDQENYIQNILRFDHKFLELGKKFNVIYFLNETFNSYDSFILEFNKIIKNDLNSNGIKYLRLLDLCNENFSEKQNFTTPFTKINNIKIESKIAVQSFTY